jgi:hypothetical protein
MWSRKNIMPVCRRPFGSLAPIRHRVADAVLTIRVYQCPFAVPIQFLAATPTHTGLVQARSSRSVVIRR